MTQIKSNHKDAFAHAQTVSKIGNWLLIGSTVIAVYTTYSGTICKSLSGANDVLNNINIVLILSYIVSELIINSLLPKAELRRRLGYLDNSFGTNFTGKHSENYYNNDNLKPGLIKLAANCFESCLFTFNISKRMIWPLAIKNVIIIVAFLAAAYLGNNKFLVLLSQLTLPVVLAQQLLKLIIYFNVNQTILDQFRELFTELRDNTSVNKEPQIIRTIIHYESNISWGSIILDSAVYKKLNPELTKEWEEYKALYNIEA